MTQNIWRDLCKLAKKELDEAGWDGFQVEATSTAGLAAAPYMRPSCIHRAELYRQGVEGWGVNVHLKPHRIPAGVLPVFGTATGSPAGTRAEAYRNGVMIAMAVLQNDRRLRAAETEAIGQRRH